MILKNSLKTYIRSSIVHSGIEYISKEKIRTLTRYTRLALYNLLLINYEFNNEINKLQQKRYN